MNYINQIFSNFFYLGFSCFLSSKPPRKPRADNSHKYKNTVIYEIRSISYPEIFYVGHTISPLKRLQQHKNEALNYKNDHLKSRYMRLIGVDDFRFTILETFSCKNRQIAELNEMKYITELRPPMNTEFVTEKQKILNEAKYMEFSGKYEFSSLYRIGKGTFKLLKIT